MTSTTESAPEERQQSPASLVDVVDWRLRERGRSNVWSGFLAAVRAGIIPAGDMQAHRVTAPFTTGLSAEKARAARRAAAIRAIHKDVLSVRATDGEQRAARKPLGWSLADLYRHSHNGKSPGGDESRTDQIVQQVNALPLLGLDEAALVLLGLIGRCSSAGIPVDFRSLAWTLAQWGDGISPRSEEARMRLVSDFYGYRPEPS